MVEIKSQFGDKYVQMTKAEVEECLKDKPSYFWEGLDLWQNHIESGVKMQIPIFIYDGDIPVQVVEG